MKIISKIASNKLFLVLFLIIIILGVYVRFNNMDEVGYWNDDQATIPAGLMWFYETSYFPGLNYGNPPIGDMIVGAGCMLSGEDFSGVSQVQPFFYPNRFNLLGAALSKADFHCHLPMYIFGLIFFILIIIFAFTFFGKYSALLLTAFFSFYPLILRLSRWIKPDIVFWTFVIAFLFFLLKYYSSNKKEYLNLTLSAIFLGLAFATKFTAAMLFIFAIIIILEKYKQQFLSILKIISKKLSLTFLQNIEDSSPKKLISHSLLFTIIFAFISLIPYKLNPLNLWRTQQSYQRFNQNLGGMEFSILNIFKTLKEFFISLNAIDSLLLLFSIYVLIKILLKKQKTKLEKFTLFLFLILIITALLFPVISSVQRAFPFLISIIFLFALIFSNTEYSIFNLFRIKNKKVFFSIFLIIYIIFSAFTVIPTSPQFKTKNQALCLISPNHDSCHPSYIGVGAKTVTSYLKPLLSEEETFIGAEGIPFFYIKHQQGLLDHQFNLAFQQQLGRLPTFLEKIEYFKPLNQTVTYLILPPDYEGESKEVVTFKQQYTPTKILKIQDVEIALVYHLKNLEKN